MKFVVKGEPNEKVVEFSLKSGPDGSIDLLANDIKILKIDEHGIIWRFGCRDLGELRSIGLSTNTTLINSVCGVDFYCLPISKMCIEPGVE